MESEERHGILAVIIAYSLWGFMPLYWKALSHVSSEEILAGRIIWSFVFTMVIVLIGRNWRVLIRDLQELRKNKKSFYSLFLASYLIAGNWFIYIYAVNEEYIVQASLGYYINPLFSVVLGILFLKETLSPAQKLAVSMAGLGVVLLIITYKEIPWISLALATTFAFYGLIKKHIAIDAIRGLTLETLFVLPVALLYFGYLLINNEAVFFTSDTKTMLLIIFTGAATAIPLILFAKGTKTMPLYMSGFFQYIAPTIMLLVGVCLYNESFSKMEFFSFSLIWLSLIVFTFSKVLEYRRKKLIPLGDL